MLIAKEIFLSGDVPQDRPTTVRCGPRFLNTNLREKAKSAKTQNVSPRDRVPDKNIDHK